MSLYEILGIDTEASSAQIKKAFRQKALKAHPDQGGSREAMEELQHAYDVLSDPERRARYDSTGEEDIPVDPEALRKAVALKLLGQVIAMVVDQPIDVDGVDIKAAIIRKVQSQTDELDGHRRKVVQALKRANAMTKRFVKTAPDGEDIVASILRAKAAELQKAIDSVDNSIATFQVVADMLAPYRYEAEPEVEKKVTKMTFGPTDWEELLKGMGR